MSEMDPIDRGMESLLRGALAAPVPTLPPDFERRVTRQLGRDSRVLGRYRRILMIGYAVVSAGTCAVLMRSAGMEWPLTAAAILGPLSVVAILPLARHAASRSSGQNAR